MNKKNILTAAVSLSLVACLSIGATLAYFTDKTDVKNNAFTTGNVDITLTDTSDSDKATEVETGIVYDDVLPGDNLDKNVYVTVDKDSSAAYVGVFVSVDYNHFGRPDSYDVMGLVNDAMMRMLDDDRLSDLLSRAVVSMHKLENDRIEAIQEGR